MPPKSKAAAKRPASQALRKKGNVKNAAVSAKKLRELEQVRKVKEPFLDMFVEALTKGDPDPSELAWHLSWRCSNPRRYDAPAACSLMLFSEALPGHVNLCDVLEAIDYHQAIRKHIGDERWEERRVRADELLKKLQGAKVSPRSFSLLHRAVSVACAKKDGPSEELKALSSATSKAVCDKDPEGACPICLAGWRADDSVLVLSCNHVLHVDCFWKMITAAGSDALRGRCRVCRAPVHWGPVARSNLRCILASALAAALVRQQQAGGGLSQSDVAEYCSRVSEEIGESFHDIWTEVPYQLLKVRQKVLPNSEMANLQRLFSTPFLR